MKKQTIALFSVIGMLSCTTPPSFEANYNVIPQPQKITLVGSDAFILEPNATIGYPKGDNLMKQNAEFLSQYLQQITGSAPSLNEGSGDITLLIDETKDKQEGYSLTVDADNGVELRGATAQGVFYAIQTLRKSLPAKTEGKTVAMPEVAIEDFPRFAYRGMMLDVGRHYFSVDSIKQFVDMLALHNLNRFHWHLTEDQGWRIEIKKYPKLTEIGSRRSGTVIGRNSGEYNNTPYEGFYTQEQVKEIVDYAASQHITIVPEIDLPGHQLAALASYPELGCTGGPYEVWKQWGVSDDVICAGREESMKFLEDVLAEVIELFPSKYIHIGGDECPKSRWEKCPRCQAKIKELGIKGDKSHSPEEYLQSYVIKRMEKFVESKGRSIIGWDEILEGGLAPNATVMSWRGTEGGITAAKQGNDAIMTPVGFCYFDYYQSADVANEPLAIGGYVPLEKAYSFEPIPDDLPAEAQKHIIGVQANIWTEYMPTFKHVQYMVMPRISALAEVQWSAEENKDYDKFLPRVVTMTQKYEALGYNYAKHVFDLQPSLVPDYANNTLTVTLEKFGEGDIYYTLDGTTPTTESNKYTEPFSIKENAHLQAFVMRSQSISSRIFSEKIYFSKSAMKSITLAEEPSKGYTFEGAVTLADGLRGTENYKTGRWLGFQGRNVDATIDMQTATSFSKVAFNTNVVKGDWIMGAKSATIQISDDGKNYKTIAKKNFESVKQTDKDGVYPQEITFEEVVARYVHVVIEYDTLPEWHGGAGTPAYLFVDEIMID